MRRRRPAPTLPARRSVPIAAVAAVIALGLAALAAAGSGGAARRAGLAPRAADAVPATGTALVSASGPIALMPGVTYERQATLTPHGPVVLHVLTGPRPGGLTTLEPVLSNDILPGSEQLSSIQRRLSPTATTAGIAGDFGTPDGKPLGLVLRAGALQHHPLATRVSLGVGQDGTLRADRLQLLGTWQGAGPRRLLSLVNGQPTGNQLAVYTPAWGPATPQLNGAFEVTLQPFPPTTSPGEISGTVVATQFGGGSTIPPDGVVLVARGSSATNLNKEAPAGQAVKLRLLLKPDWTGVVDGIGGGPLLVKSGIAVFRPADAFPAADLLARAARGAVGQKADGAILLVTVEGGKKGSSVGMTSFELAQAMVRLGAVTAVGQVTGTQAGMGFDGTLLSRPQAAEQGIADALLLVYRGVYVPLLASVLSPDGDGVADTIQLFYKTVRPSKVSAQLIGPDGGVRLADQGDRAAQTFTFTWSGTAPAGGPEAEGLYRWVVSATDDQGRQSSMERQFALNRTLGRLKSGAVLRTSVPQGTGAPVATYALTRPARVAVSILSGAGVAVATLPVQQLAAGRQTVTWDARNPNGLVPTGRYTVSVAATNELGTVTLAAPFSVSK